MADERSGNYAFFPGKVSRGGTPEKASLAHLGSNYRLLLRTRLLVTSGIDSHWPPTRNLLIDRLDYVDPIGDEVSAKANFHQELWPRGEIEPHLTIR
jgi:hypothetical protein